MKDVIGIIGGMGPMASQLFYKMVTEHIIAEKDMIAFAEKEYNNACNEKFSVLENLGGCL